MGWIVLVAVLAAAVAIGLPMRQRQGRFKPFSRPTRPLASPASPLTGDVITAEDLRSPLGSRATLVQFSTEFCANCPPTRRLLDQVARGTDGVVLVEVDAAARLDLTRRLHVYSTPTVLVLGPDGAIVSRASGQPRKSDVLAAVGPLLRTGAP